MIDDSDLKKRFEELRADEARSAPRFDPSARRETRFVPRRLAMATAALLVLSLGVVVGVRDRSRSVVFDNSDRLAVRSVDAWRAPTEFLLDTPGSELLNTTPTIPDLAIVLPSPKGSSL